MIGEKLPKSTKVNRRSSTKANSKSNQNQKKKGLELKKKKSGVKNTKPLFES